MTMTNHEVRFRIPAETVHKRSILGIKKGSFELMRGMIIITKEPSGLRHYELDVFMMDIEKGVMHGIKDISGLQIWSAKFIEPIPTEEDNE